MRLPDCEVCGVCLMGDMEWKNCSDKYGTCCKECESAYTHVIRLKERLKVEENKVDNLRASLKKTIRDSKCQNEQYILPSKSFNELWNQLHYLGCKYDTCSELLDERLTYGWLTVAAFDLFRKKEKGLTLREKIQRLYEAVMRIAKFEGWDKVERERLEYNAEDLINRIKEL